LISISFCTFSSVTVKVTDENVQKEIDINTEVLGIVNGEIVNVTDENVQREIDINFLLGHQSWPRSILVQEKTSLISF
jgi:hypothetical protein